MDKYTAPKGTFDVLPNPQGEENVWKSSHLWSYFETVAFSLAHIYNFQQIRTPIFEHLPLFLRTIGETSDIVSKEMYTFLDKKERQLCLRPEGTAPILRALLQNGKHTLKNGCKVCYSGPFFRYDRPQAGRYRQFHQFGVEAIGRDSAQQDFEVISLLLALFRKLGLSNLELRLNTLGAPSDREKYKTELLQFLQPHFSHLTPESQKRFRLNPLRILDSKDPKEKELLHDAPSLMHTLTSSAKSRFDLLCTLLREAAIPFTVDHKLVRGLDYYNHVVFEVITSDLGAQNALGGGGRYNGLFSEFGGPDLPAIGFAIGIERILSTMISQHVSLPNPFFPTVCLVPIGKETQSTCFSLLYQLRQAGISSEIIYQKNLQKGLQEINRLGGLFAAIVGDEELHSQQVQIKEMKTKKVQHVPISTCTSFFINQPKPIHYAYSHSP